MSAPKTQDVVPIPVWISGIRGRLGSCIARFVREADDLELKGGLVRPGRARSEAPSGEGDVSELPESPRAVLVEAGPIEAWRNHAAQHERVGAVLVATTGLTGSDQSTLETLARTRPVLVAPNLSLGVAVLHKLVHDASARLRAYDVEVVELHHNQKRDAPSGTAWHLAEAAAEARGLDVRAQAMTARSGEVGARHPNEIGIQAMRGGGIVGEHTVYFAGQTERLELSHRAESRDVFAAGAIQGIRFLAAEARAPGLYRMADVVEKDVDSA